MFERFTDRARRVVVLAQEEARTLNHNYIGTEHILLGLVHEGEGVAARALKSLGVSPQSVREQVEAIIGRGQTAPPSHIPFTPRAKKVLELSLREAMRLGHNYIGTEHVLLGLIREGEGVAAQVLTMLGVRLDPLRQEIMRVLTGHGGEGSVMEHAEAQEVVGAAEAAEAEEAVALAAQINRLDDDVLVAIARARDLARDLGHPTTDVAHLLVTIAAMPDTAGGQALAASGCDKDTLRALVPQEDRDLAGGAPPLSPQASVLLYRAARRGPATTAALVAEILAAGSVLERDLLRRAGVDLDELPQQLGAP